jgi:dihydropteroate synthase
MGILNVTPDSFSGDGLLASSSSDSLPRTLEQARRFLTAGADILDVGGESTRPGAQQVGADEELARVVPVIEALRRESDVLISIDTYKSSVAEAALKAGADIVNDVWGFRADPDLATVTAKHQAPAILMHNRSKPGNADVQARLGGRCVGMEYAIRWRMSRRVDGGVAIARAAGIPDESHVDGIGLGRRSSRTSS